MERMRNIGIFAHVDAGKTTTTEHLLYISGHIRTLGSVDSGTAQTDWLDVERERGISVRAASTTFGWRGYTINLVDTPGHVDFLSEVERSLRVMDGAIVIVSAVEGVQAQTETIWHALRKQRMPALLYMNKLDRIGARPAEVAAEIAKLLTDRAVPIQAPLGQGESFRGVAELWGGEEPAMQASELEQARQTALEKMAECDDRVLERYLAGEAIAPPEARAIAGELARRAELHPLLYGASSKGIGVAELLQAAVDFLPPPAGQADKPLSAVVFKLERDKTMGRLAFVRVYDGTIRNRDTVRNFTGGTEEKVTQIRLIDGRKHEDAGIVEAGGIAALCGLQHARVGDVLGVPDAVPPAQHLAVPLLTVQVKAASDALYPALTAALQELSEEDPHLDAQWLAEERELHLKVMGNIQLEIIANLLQSRFGLAVTFGQPSIIYKETPSRAGYGFIAYTMPKPCWAILRFAIEPGERGSGLRYRSLVRTDDLLAQYQNEVERRVPEALLQGMRGWEVTDLAVTLVEGQHHVWHTHPLDFAVATPMGIMQGLAETGTTLLEPLLHFRIAVPEEYGGKVLAELAQMRATFEPPSVAGGRLTVEGAMPAATSLEYPVKLSSQTGGRGTIATSFAGYAPAPPDVQAERQRRGVNPLDQAKYILSARKALSV
ncbi:MAG: TetM/TetW/TetO/TetS family tetracycline resistance ribosomal protection protein [Paenibacillaceae bacterium]|nr:TetM/TetW/TetO/TetS family tetracycline resistance ribosomal protection protein [Paenibacillaceae bacterium]